MTIKIKKATKEITAYDKNITFEREGVEYSVTLRWDAYDGYNIYFDGMAAPDWFWEWEDDDHDGESLDWVLDYLSDEKLNEPEWVCDPMGFPAH